MNTINNKKKLTRWATFLGVSGFIAVLLAVGSDDARDFATPTERKHLNIANPKTTHTMAFAGMASMLGAAALLRKRDNMDKQR
jgi:hypothetical protein